MMFLPDSAVLGTLKKLKGGKGGKRGRAISDSKPKPIVLAQSWDCFDQDSRSFEELLAMARLTIEKQKQHAE